MAGFLLTFLLTSVAVGIAILRWWQPAPDQYHRILLLSLGLGPVVASRLLTWEWSLLPGLDGPIALLGVTATLLACAWSGRSAWPTLSFTLRATLTRPTPTRLLRVGTTLALALWLPLAILTALHGLLTLRHQESGQMAISLLSRLASRLDTLLASLPPPLADATLPWLPLTLGLGTLALLGVGSLARSTRSSDQSPQPAGPALLTILDGLILSLAGSMTLLAILLPPVENDALQYLHVAEVMVRHRALDFYPVTTALPESGFYAPSSHPPAYYGMIAWCYLVQGATDSAGLAKFLAPLYLLHLLPLLALALANQVAVVRRLAMLLLLSTPAIFNQTIALGIDSQRIYLLFATLLWWREARIRQTTAAWLILGGVAGLSLYSHSLSGILTPLFLLLAGLADRSAMGSARWRIAILLLGTASLVGGDRYLGNLREFGVPFYDGIPIYQAVPALDPLGDAEAGSGLHTPGQRLAAGLLIGFQFMKGQGFGLTYEIALLGLPWLWRKRQDPELCHLLLPVGGFLAFMSLYFLGSRESIGYATNYRYMMTIQPWIACLGAMGLLELGMLLGRAPWRRTVGWLLCGFGMTTATLAMGALRHGGLWDGASPFAPRLTHLERVDPQTTNPFVAPLALMRQVRALTPDHALFLVFHQNLFAYYAGRRWMRDLDPRMQPFYLAATPREAHLWLWRTGITHVYLPPWEGATVTHSHILPILASPSLAVAVAEVAGYRIFRLLPPPGSR